MTKEQFIASRDEIKKNISQLRDKHEQLILEYIKANKRFEIGDRVQEGEIKEFGYVNDYGVDYRDEVKHICRKEKKDGTPSLHSMFIVRDRDLKLSPKP